MKSHPNYIDGVWRDGATAAPNINPSDLSDVIGVFARADAEQATEAVEAAAAARPEWARLPGAQRFDVLDRAGGRRSSPGPMSWATCWLARRARPCPRPSPR